MAQYNREDVVNFAPGPAAIATEVLEKAQESVLNYNGLGVGVMELSHRSSEYKALNQETMDLLREILKIPDDYYILFLQGGGTGQFAAIPLNLTAGKDDIVDYLVTGAWSKKAAEEAKKYASVNYPLPMTDSYTDIPPQEQWRLSPNATYLYYADNETIHGVEFPNVPDVPGVTLVCDMSSNFITRKVDVSKFGLIYAGVQKNVGCAGLVVVIVRKDLVTNPRNECPTFINFAVQAKADSTYNTPNVWGVYIFNLVLKWVKDQGGIEAMAALSSKKSALLYDFVAESHGFYHLPVMPKARSRVNVPMRIWNSGAPSTALEEKFIAEAKKAKIIHVNGHRSVGGLRVSLYNAVTVKNTLVLLAFMKKFMIENNSEP